VRAPGGRGPARAAGSYGPPVLRDAGVLRVGGGAVARDPPCRMRTREGGEPHGMAGEGRGFGVLGPPNLWEEHLIRWEKRF
jgi:hypothetical protein